MTLETIIPQLDAHFLERATSKLNGGFERSTTEISRKTLECCPGLYEFLTLSLYGEEGPNAQRGGICALWLLNEFDPSWFEATLNGIGNGFCEQEAAALQEDSPEYVEKELLDLLRETALGKWVRKAANAGADHHWEAGFYITLQLLLNITAKAHRAPALTV